MVIQRSNAYKRLLAQLPMNLVLFDPWSPYVEHNIHWIMQKTLTWDEKEHPDKIIWCLPNNVPDAKFVLSHFPNLHYRLEEHLNELRPESTLLLLEKRPLQKFSSFSMQNAQRKWEQTAKKEGVRREVVAQESKVLEDVQFNVKFYSKSEAVFRIGQKLDDPMWSWGSTMGYWGIPRFLANEKFDRVMNTRYDKYGRHIKMPRFSEEIRARTWKLRK